MPSSLRPIFGTYALAAGDLSHLTNEVKCTVLFEAITFTPTASLIFSITVMKAGMKKNVIVLLYHQHALLKKKTIIIINFLQILKFLGFF